MTEEEAFLLCRLPGKQKFERYCFTSSDDATLRFGEASVHLWPECTLGGMSVRTVSTSRKSYLDNVEALESELKKTGGKTVVCRQICGDFSDFDPEQLADRYFRAFPDMFCFLFYHPSTKWWMGATPELLLQSCSLNAAQTRALAGTQLISDGEPWSDKNKVEHRFVADDIINRLMDIKPAMRVTAHAPENLKYGKIQHLCTPISIESNGTIPFDSIINAIHPTPAVCGYPRETALGHIKEIEEWPRNCYGGYISVPSPAGRIAYVMLRCVHFDERHWAVYTGSGITGDSVATDEWNETDAKAAPLVNVLKSFSLQ